ncbi:GNAT family N-acetyltransferase [Legionella parisiensis]|uniref:Putative N-acetyltransferase YafP n=1 Tax=Legionella parisiensis TaxID=45071 RepID=A0A1E5JQZ1_9GAMM|nr:GNAT family N-acetyltransferase [Legionella parisiensis]KTD41563.1 putative N-acetyltransferase YafP [Legionella parisiensis]OEH46860.1 putative N-acetyltransferase YafP [Legionella parisiensis]STX76119.1 N-acetyltransferase GCN5 [Legionella parisiensis]
MTVQEQKINRDVLQKTIQILQQHFATKIEINCIQFLSEKERRNIVVRITLKSKSSSVPQSIILKQSLPEASDRDDKDAYARFARDWAGLEFANQIHQSIRNVPHFYGGNKEYRFILIEDLGKQHISLVDSLTLPYKEKAILALKRFMKSLGNLHAASYGKTALYEALLKKIHGNIETMQEDIDFIRADLLEKLQAANRKLHLPLATECINEANHLIESLLKPGPFTVLTHGDICPDNVFDHEETHDLQLIDFEWAFVRNALLDGTYLRMSMPTCWCAKSIPEEIIVPLEIVYREELKRTIPAASDDLAYIKAYTEACGFWLLQQTLPFLNSALEKDRVGPSGPVPENSLWNNEENWVRPRVLSRLQAFIHVASRNNLLPHLKKMAENILLELKKIWAAKSLEFYPAFAASNQKFYIRTFEPGDEAEIYQLFYETVHNVNCKDYTKEQLQAWAPINPNLSEWQKSLIKNYTFVAIDKESDKIIGFSDLEENGHLNRGYVHKDYQKQGVGKALLEAREHTATALGIPKLFSDVSITAKQFFESCGYITEVKQTQVLNGMILTNYRMTKSLLP